MKIFGLIKRNSGPDFHRIWQPLEMMPDTDVYITNAVEEKDFEERRPDLIYYNRMISDDILLLQSKYHFRVAVDFDDYWHLDPHHVMFKYSKLNNIPEHHIKHCRIADIVTTTHERLADEIYKLNKNVVIVPNAIPDNEYFPVNKTESAKGHRRIFWQGSVTHEKDVSMLRATMKKLDPEKFMSVVCGYNGDEPIWDRIADTLTAKKKLPHVVFPGVPVTDYYSNYQYADIAVVPLLSSVFNGFKSCLKVLEAAHSGIPVIASNVHPYKNMAGVLYPKNNEDWLRLLNLPQDELNAAAAELSDFCKLNYDFKTINLKRREAFL